MDEREHARADHREQRHRFGESVDAGAPLLLEEEKDGADQRAGVADADPPDEVDDAERPADGDVVSPRADALVQGDRDCDEQPVRSVDVRECGPDRDPQESDRAQDTTEREP